MPLNRGGSRNLCLRLRIAAFTHPLVERNVHIKRRLGRALVRRPRAASHNARKVDTRLTRHDFYVMASFADCNASRVASARSRVRMCMPHGSFAKAVACSSAREA